MTNKTQVIALAAAGNRSAWSNRWRRFRMAERPGSG